MKLDLGEIIDDLALRFILSCPEEDYEELDRLMFQFELAHWFYQDEYLDKYPDDLPYLTFSNFCSEIFQRVPMLQCYAQSVREHIASFNKYKNQVPVCGCLLLNKNMTKVLMIQAFGAKSWNFPRGKINQGETHMECAIRETKEEIGFIPTPESLNEDRYIETTFGKKKVKLYIVENVDESTSFKTLTTKEIAKIHWQNLANLSPNQYKFRNAWPVIQKLKQWIRKYKKDRKNSPKHGREQRASAFVNSVDTVTVTAENGDARKDRKSVYDKDKQQTNNNKRQKNKSQSNTTSQPNYQSNQNNSRPQTQRQESTKNYPQSITNNESRGPSKRRSKSKRDNNTSQKLQKGKNSIIETRMTSPNPTPLAKATFPTAPTSFQNFSFDAKEMLRAIHG